MNKIDMSSATDLIGRSLGGYRLVEIIGSGAVATVFKAYQPDLDRWVATKVLHYNESSTRIRFQREAKAIALLRHRNILLIYEYGEEEDWPYIVMEYVQQGSLKDQLKRQPMPWANVVNLMIPVADALSYAHGHGIVHRDVKPSNILLPASDWPLLADFGLVKLAQAEEALTKAGTSMGTPAYVAPEQARGDEVDRRSDVYSLGIILFELITGRLPFDYPNPNKMLLAHISEPAPNPRTFNPDCPATLEKVILTCLQKEPADRYATMTEVITALQDVSAAETASVPATPPPPRREPSYRQPKRRQETILFRPKATDESQPASDPLDDTSPSLPLASPPVQPEAKAPDVHLFIAEGDITLDVPQQDSVIIGRTHKQTIADVNLGPYGAAQVGVSRHHARLIRQRGQWLIDDMGSLNGTFVNEVRVNSGQPVPLKNGDMIRCSHMSFLFLVS